MFSQRIRQLVSETAVYGVSSIVGRLINFALVPFYTNVLPIDHYGVVILLYTAFVFLNIVYTYGMESAYLRFASGSAGRERTRETFSAASWSLFGTALVFSGLILIFRPQAAWLVGIQENWYDLLIYGVLIISLDALAVVPLAELRLSSKPWRFAITKLIHIAVNVTLNLYLILGLDMGVRAIFIANLSASAAVLISLMPEYRRLLRPVFERALWRRLVKFGLPFVPGGLAYALSERVSFFFLGKLGRDQVLRLYGDQIDMTVLAAQAASAVEALAREAGTTATQLAQAAEQVYGQHVVSIYGTAYKLAIFMMLVSQMFRYAWQPFFLNRAEDPDAKQLFSRVFTLFSAAALGVTLGVSFFAQELVSIPLPGDRHLIPEPYWLGLQIVPVALLGYVLQGWYYNFSAGIYLTEKTRYFVHATVFGGLTSLALTALLVPRFGMMGAVTATLAAFSVMAFVLYFYAQRAYRIRYDWRRVGVLVASALAILGCWSFLVVLQTWIIEAVLLACYLLVVYVVAVRGTASEPPEGAPVE